MVTLTLQLKRFELIASLSSIVGLEIWLDYLFGPDRSVGRLNSIAFLIIKKNEYSTLMRLYIFNNIYIINLLRLSLLILIMRLDSKLIGYLMVLFISIHYALTAFH